MMVSFFSVVAFLSVSTAPSSAFSPSPTWSLFGTKSQSSLSVHTLRDADFFEMMVGGERYEMVPLPDSMLDTTLFVGNLNEFANDQDLSDTFCKVTTLSSVPAVVARKANMNSLHYGFVTFATVQEKEAAILKFHNSQFMGQKIKVEEIRDHRNKGRVKVPERMVNYVIGDVKRTPYREVNTMRRVSKPTVSYAKKKKKSKRTKKKRKLQTYKLSDKEQAGFQRAIRSGFVTLNGTGFRRGRKTCNLACAHRQWCDTSVSKPQIIHCKASGGRPLDCVIVDLSPLRNPGFQYLEVWKEQIALAAQSTGMELRLDYVEDNCQDDDECSIAEIQDKPISNLPVISMGVYEGERNKAKAMARELASLWGLPSDQEMPAQSSQQNVRKKQLGGGKQENEKRKNNKRRQNRRQQTDFFF